MTMTTPKYIIDWLLEGDVSVQYQTHRDLMDQPRPDLQNKIENEGWGQEFLSRRNRVTGHWGDKFYQPKWISSHYTLLDLKNIGIHSGLDIATKVIAQIIKEERAPDGGVKPIGEAQRSDVCVNGMFLNYASYFKTPQEALSPVVDMLLEESMGDGGFNCRSNRSGAVHSSMHSTISVLEGFWEYLKNGYTYRMKEIDQARTSAHEFLLMHHLYKSDRTGRIIHKDFLKLSYPGRWKYDILRALDYFQSCQLPYDHRMQDALDVLIQKRNKKGLWNVQAKHPGQVHFDMEKAGQSSRWNTLRVCRVFKQFEIEGYENR